MVDAHESIELPKKLLANLNIIVNTWAQVFYLMCMPEAGP